MAVYIKQEPFRLILAKANKTQTAVADELGINPTYFNNMIAGRDSVAPATRDNIMEKLEVLNWDSIFEMRD